MQVYEAFIVQVYYSTYIMYKLCMQSTSSFIMKIKKNCKLDVDKMMQCC